MKETERKVLNFEIKKTRYYLGNSDRFVEVDEGDMNFPVRIKQIRKEINDYIDRLKAKYGIKDIDDIANVKTGNEEEELQIISDTDLFIKDRLNYAFDYDVSSAAFGSASCLSVTENGEYYFENFLNSILPVIEATFGVRIDKLSVRIKKYTDKKGLHPAFKK